MALYTAVLSGDWNDNATWDGATYPQAGDDATIPSGIDVTVVQNEACDSLVVNGSVNLTGFTLTVDSLSVSDDDLGGSVGAAGGVNSVIHINEGGTVTAGTSGVIFTAGSPAGGLLTIEFDSGGGGGGSSTQLIGG